MLKDSENVRDTSGSRLPTNPYNKTQKLITALFMVTDIMDKDEPLRKKLRELGTAILSEGAGSASLTAKYASEIISFLDVASAVKMISAMNAGILKKEFNELKTSLGFGGEDDSAWLERLMAPSRIEVRDSAPSYSRSDSTRIGVQKGSTLLQALSDKMPALSNSRTTPVHTNGDDFHVLKDQRRGAIITVIKSGGESGMTISDIRNSAKGLDASNPLASMSEKTLQRELLSMLKDKVIQKTGEKRWSKYFI